MPSTQNFLQFSAVRDDTIVMKDGGLRALLSVPSVNFGLKSQDEQDAITYAFQNFLNSLDFDLQIIVHSQKIDVEPYLRDLQDRAQRQETELMRRQTEEYIEFIRSFVKNSNVMTKRFYIIVPFSAFQAKKKSEGLLSALSSLIPSKSKGGAAAELDFKAAHAQLLQRVEFVAQNLLAIGLETRLLTTEEIIQLLWQLYNPEQRNTSTMPQFIAQQAQTAP